MHKIYCIRPKRRDRFRSIYSATNFFIPPHHHMFPGGVPVFCGGYSSSRNAPVMIGPINRINIRPHRHIWYQSIFILVTVFPHIYVILQDDIRYSDILYFQENLSRMILLSRTQLGFLTTGLLCINPCFPLQYKSTGLQGPL